MKEFLRFSRGERIASLIILALTLAVLLALAYVRHVRPLPEDEVRAFDSLITAVLPAEEANPADEHEAATGAGMQSTDLKELKEPPPVRDPNTMTKEEWNELALPPRVIRTLINYRSKGGVFRKKEDVKKIYGMTDSLYDRISPYIQVKEKIPVDTLPSSEEEAVREAVSLSLVEINTADSATLDSLPDVPPFLARRIVKYRNLLGGFARKEQLLEVYGLDSLTYDRIEKRITVDTLQVRKINVNSCDEYTLARHPYLSRREAGAVIFYREHFGRISDLNVLRTEHVLPEKPYSKDQ